MNHIAYSITCDGQHVGNVHAHHKDAADEMTRLNDKFPGPVREIVGLIDAPKLEDVQRFSANLRALDVALNGDIGAASAPALVDILAQVQAWQRAIGMPLIPALAHAKRWLELRSLLSAGEDDPIANEFVESLEEFGADIPTPEDLDILADRMIAKREGMK